MILLQSKLLGATLDDYVGFTFFIGYMAMADAAVFFFVERGSVDAKWKMSLLVRIFVKILFLKLVFF